MPNVVTVLLFCHRLPDLTAEEFRIYCEETHVPLVKGLLGADHPSTHTRYYTHKDVGFAMGSPTLTDPDLIAVITYESREALERSMRARRADGVREKIEADEDKFMDRSRLRLIVLSDDDVGRSV